MEDMKKRDSADYLNDEDIKNISNIIKSKRILMSYFKEDYIVNMIRDLIDESKYIEFTSKRTRKFISGIKPTFNIIVDINSYIKDKDIKLYAKTEERISRLYQECLNNEVYTPFSNRLQKIIEKESDNNEIFKELPDIKDIILLSNIFAIRIDLKTSKVILEYLI